jgi:hypothetical protein
MNSLLHKGMNQSDSFVKCFFLMCNILSQSVRNLPYCGFSLCTGSPCSYKQLCSWRKFIKQNFLKLVDISHKRYVIIGGYVPEWLKNDQKEKLEINNFIPWNETYKQRKQIITYDIKMHTKAELKANRLMHLPWFHWLTGRHCILCLHFH